jgi:hypothetical protein
MDRAEELQSMNYEMLDYLRTQLVWLLVIVRVRIIAIVHAHALAFRNP